MNADALALLFAATMALAAPLLFAALGELISERAGILNINLEAMMLSGAFVGVWAANITSSLTAGFLGAALAAWRLHRSMVFFVSCCAPSRS